MEIFVHVLKVSLSDGAFLFYEKECCISISLFQNMCLIKRVQWSPFLTTAQIATTFAITTDLQIRIFPFI